VLALNNALNNCTVCEVKIHITSMPVEIMDKVCRSVPLRGGRLSLRLCLCYANLGVGPEGDRGKPGGEKQFAASVFATSVFATSVLTTSAFATSFLARTSQALAKGRVSCSYLASLARLAKQGA
jgi:hypothetical protein